MKPSRITEFPGALRQMAQAIENLPNLDTLPSLCDLAVKWDHESNALVLSGQLSVVSDDMRTITELNTWAAALSGSLLLGDENPTSIEGLYWRRLTALARLANGVLFEVWDHLNYTTPTPSEPVAA